MRLHILSDLHLEFAPFMPPSTGADMVILAGDIRPGMRSIPWIQKTFPDTPVVYVLGNHEYYGQALPRHLEKLKEAASGTNIHILENDCLDTGEVVIMGCTLWTDFELFGNPRVAGYFATQGMNDYRRIRLNPSYRRLRSLDTAVLHYQSRHWMENQFKIFKGRKIVVVTHHSPSTRSLPVNYEQDILSAASASKLDELVAASGACLWVHGHIHHNQDYFIGKTRVICNPRGYPEEQNTDFLPDMVIEV